MLKIEIDTGGLIQLAAKYGDAHQRLTRRLVIAVNKAAASLHAYTLRSKLSGSPIKRRSGNLSRALTLVPAKVASTGEIGEVKASVRMDLSKAPYARVQEYGGTITPKNSRYLTIPVGKALTAAGVPRFTARQLIDNPGVAGMEGTFVIDKGSYKVIMGRAANGAASPLFVLKRSVTLRPTGYMSKSLTEHKGAIQGFIDEAVADYVLEMNNLQRK